MGAIRVQSLPARRGAEAQAASRALPSWRLNLREALALGMVRGLGASHARMPGFRQPPSRVLNISHQLERPLRLREKPLHNLSCRGRLRRNAAWFDEQPGIVGCQSRWGRPRPPLPHVPFRPGRCWALPAPAARPRHDRAREPPFGGLEDLPQGLEGQKVVVWLLPIPARQPMLLSNLAQVSQQWPAQPVPGRY